MHDGPKSIILYKPLGTTPLECIAAFRKKNAEYATVKLAYAGRLDPMAEGVLLVLVGDECKNRERYESLPKVYDVDMLLGVSTDTGDVMGVVTHVSKVAPIVTDHTIDDAILRVRGTRQQAYPSYASKTVSGHPLYWWARHGRLHEIVVPHHTITIEQITVRTNGIWKKDTGVQTITDRISLMAGEFRQKEIISCWKEISANLPSDLPYITFQISCGSGAYMRVLVEEIGAALGIPTLALSIKRVSIGPYTLSDAGTL